MNAASMLIFYTQPGHKEMPKPEHNIRGKHVLGKFTPKHGFGAQKPTHEPWKLRRSAPPLIGISLQPPLHQPLSR